MLSLITWKFSLTKEGIWGAVKHLWIKLDIAATEAATEVSLTLSCREFVEKIK